MFEGFEQKTIKTSGADIHCVIGGSGPPVLLLHGYPQTHVMWHRVAPELARSYTVVVPDLRGYGDSSRPDGGPDHAGYSKRTMARDQIEVMASLGFESFVLLGHDRGARVGHRMALDAPDKVTKLAVLDIVPTYHVFEVIDKEMATAYYHWFFLIQPYDLPEKLIGGDPIYYLHRMLGGLGTGLDIMAAEALAEYERCFQDPAVIHATCEDYRAAASIDLVHDEADRGRNKVQCPVLALWGAKGRLDRAYDVLEVWRDYARDVRGRALPCGHFLGEERPEETSSELLAFLRS
jgi:haloacetate dehalogenase